MSSSGHRFLIKYGLRSEPSDAAIRNWLRYVNEFIQKGFSKDQAGEKAAEAVFPDYNSAVYASQADDILALLDAAKNK